MKTSQTFQKLMQYVKPYRLFFVLSILLAIVAVVTQLYIPILFGQCIDCMISQGHVDLARLATFGSKIGILIMVNAIATWFMNVVNNHMAFSIVKDMRAQIMRQIQHLPLSFYSRTNDCGCGSNFRWLVVGLYSIIFWSHHDCSDYCLYVPY